MSKKVNKETWTFAFSNEWNPLGFSFIVLAFYWDNIMREITILNFVFTWIKD